MERPRPPPQRLQDLGWRGAGWRFRGRRLGERALGLHQGEAILGPPRAGWAEPAPAPERRGLPGVAPAPGGCTAGIRHSRGCSERRLRDRLFFCEHEVRRRCSRASLVTSWVTPSAPAPLSVKQVKACLALHCKADGRGNQTAPAGTHKTGQAGKREVPLWSLDSWGSWADVPGRQLRAHLGQLSRDTLPLLFWGREPVPGGLGTLGRLWGRASEAGGWTSALPSLTSCPHLKFPRLET